MKKSILLLILLLFQSGLFAQSWQGINAQVLEAIDKKDYDTAQQLATKGIEAAKKEFGENHLNYGVALYNLGNIYQSLGKKKLALPYYVQGLEILKKELGEGNAEFIEFQSNLAILYKDLGMQDEAAQTYTDIIVNSVKYYGDQHPLYAINMINFANALESWGEAGEAKALLEAHIKALGDLKGKDDSNYNLLLNQLGVIYKNEGKYKEALSYFQKVLENTKDNSSQQVNYFVFLGNVAETYRSMGDYDKALPFFDEALSISEKSAGKNSPNYFNILNSQGYTYLLKGDIARALAIYSLAKKEAGQALGKDSFTYNTLITGEAEVYRKMENYDTAQKLILEALEGSKKNFGENSLNYITQLGSLGEIYRNLAKYKEAEDTYQKMLKLAEENLGKDNPEYYRISNNVVALYQTMGEYTKALEKEKEIVDNVGKILGKNHPFYGLYLGNLADIYRNLGDFEKSIQSFEEAKQTLSATIGKTHEDYINIVNNEALAYSMMGNYNKALDLYLEMKKTLEEKEMYGNTYNLMLNNLSDLYRSMGKYDKAISYCQKALEATEKKFGKEHPSTIMILNNLSNIYTSTGQNEKALETQLRAIQIIKLSLGENHPNFPIYLSNLSMIYRNLYQLDKAIEVATEALNLAKKNWQENNPMYPTIINNVGTLYIIRDEYDNALPYIEDAIRITEKYSGKNNPNYSTFLGNLAMIYSEKKQNDKAEKFFLEALESTKKSLGEDHQSYGLVLNNTAIFYIRQNKPDVAYPLILQAIENTKSQIKQNFSFLSEKEKENFIQEINPYFASYKSFFNNYYSKNSGVSKTFYDVELLTKGMILTSSQNLKSAVENSENPEVKRIYAEWLKKKAELAAQYTLPLAKRNSNLKQWEEEAENLEKKLMQLSNASVSNSQIGKTTWQSIQNRLQENEVAIEFSSFRVFDGSQWTDTIQYTALVLKKNDSRPQLISLFTQKQLDELLTQTGSGTTRVQNLYRGSEGNDTGQHDLQKLYSLIWKPIETYLKTGDIVYFSPSGTLNQIAFAAITTPSGKYLSDLYDLRQVSTTAKLLEPQEKIKLDHLALFGGINYDESQDALSAAAKNINGKENFVSRALDTDLQRGGENWNYLKGTMSEVEDIKAIAEKEKLEVGYYTGNKALEEQFKALSRKNSPEILHIATHGFFFPDPQKSKEELNKLPIGGEKQNMFKLSDNPLNRSGLVFAGGNHTWKGESVKPGMEDGILTAYEVSNVSLFNTQLVVLSACDTGLGDIKGSEGVYGLQRSFKIAGAQYLMMSLWQVPDKETAEFMNYFYQTLFKNKTIEESYHATQAYMKGKYPKDPYKWAAFVLVR